MKDHLTLDSPTTSESESLADTRIQQVEDILKKAQSETNTEPSFSALRAEAELVLKRTSKRAKVKMLAEHVEQVLIEQELAHRQSKVNERNIKIAIDKNKNEIKKQTGIIDANSEQIRVLKTRKSRIEDELKEYDASEIMQKELDLQNLLIEEGDGYASETIQNTIATLSNEINGYKKLIAKLRIVQDELFELELQSEFAQDYCETLSVDQVHEESEILLDDKLRIYVSLLLEDKEVVKSYSEYVISSADEQARNEKLEILSTWRELTEKQKNLETDYKSKLRACNHFPTEVQIDELIDNLDPTLSENEREQKLIELKRIRLRRMRAEEELAHVAELFQFNSDELEKLKKHPKAILDKANVDKKQLVSQENADAYASLMYEQISEYAQQLKSNGFVWLPSTLEYQDEIVMAQLSGRFPALIGESGTGKSEGADAAAEYITGLKPTHVQCGPGIGHFELIAKTKIGDDGSTYEEYGPLMQAFTGYEDSRQESPSVPTGRFCRFDEISLMGMSGYSLLKYASQKRPGQDFFGKPVLPGAGLIFTDNPDSPRYRGRGVKSGGGSDVAAERERARIEVEYPPMTNDNPELYEFALACLMKDGEVWANKNEISPHYEEFAKESDLPLEIDGKVVEKIETLNTDRKSKEHGALWRFCHAVGAMQTAFIAHTKKDKREVSGLLHFIGSEKGGTLTATEEQKGDPLTLEKTTMTLGEVGAWLEAFQKNKNQTLQEFLDTFIKTSISRSHGEDKAKLEALFTYFGFLGGKPKQQAPEDYRILTQSEIGYLSPRVPRPVIYKEEEKKITETGKESSPHNPDLRKDKPANLDSDHGQEAVRFLVKPAMIKDGQWVEEKISMEYDKESDTMIEKTVKVEALQPLEVKPGIVFSLMEEDDEGEMISVDYVYEGEITEASDEYQGKYIAQHSTEEGRFIPITAEQLDEGLLNHFEKEMNEQMEQLTEQVKEFWEEYCEGENADTYNKSGAKCPV